jgi:hypothetical protein
MTQALYAHINKKKESMKQKTDSFKKINKIDRPPSKPD